MKKIYIYLILLLGIVSCTNFLDTYPYDEMSPETTWNDEDDAEAFVVGCYDNWVDGWTIPYMDCASDIGYNNFPWEGYLKIGNGTFTAASTGHSFYDYTCVRRCNTFMEHIGNIEFSDADTKADLIAQVRTIRAYQYFVMNFWYGGVAIITNYNSADEAKVPRNSESEVKQYVYNQLDSALLDINEEPSARGRIAKGTVLAIKMRSALYWGDYERSLSAAKAIVDLNQYELDDNYTNLFTLDGQSSKEIICPINYLATYDRLKIIGRMYNNEDGGWSSIVPTEHLIDMYEMNDGKTIEESTSYDPVHPFANRDPRLAMTVLYPGMDWKFQNKNTVILNTLDETVNGSTNNNYPTAASNSSKTSLSWAKYTTPSNQYDDVWNTSCSPILFRYAEVLLTLAETENELYGPTDDAYDALDMIRKRVGMPEVDRTKYNTKSTLRMLIRRERCVELAGEGLRRADIVRWTDENGDMLAKSLLNEELTRITGTIDYNESDPTMRAVIDTANREKIETRIFKDSNRYFPIPQTSIDNNPNLEQNEGY